VNEVTTVLRLARYVERFKKITFSRVYNEVASQPTVSSHEPIVWKLSKLRFLANKIWEFYISWPCIDASIW